MRSAAFPACTGSPRRPASPQVRSSRALKAVRETTLAPGNYTAQVTGVNGTTGVALVEVYEVP